MRKKGDRKEDYMLEIGELRQLLYWATFGVQNANGGSYGETIIPTILKLSNDINFPIENKRCPLKFGFNL